MKSKNTLYIFLFKNLTAAIFAQCVELLKRFSTGLLTNIVDKAVVTNTVFPAQKVNLAPYLHRTND